MKAEKVLDFLTKHGTKVELNESHDYVELMMDNHKCIEYCGEQYYIPEDTALSEKDEKVNEYLIDNFLI